eukprot:766766-Hanusia_phi.AAC.3
MFDKFDLARYGRMKSWLEIWREQVKGAGVEGELHKVVGHDNTSSRKGDHGDVGSTGADHGSEEVQKKRKESLVVEDTAWSNGMMCPYCSIPSFISRCCKLRSSDPLRWTHGEVFEALDVLSTSRHALARQLGCLPVKEDTPGRKLRLCFESQQVDGEKMFATAMGKEADAKTFNRSVRRGGSASLMCLQIRPRPAHEDVGCASFRPPSSNHVLRRPPLSAGISEGLQGRRQRVGDIIRQVAVPDSLHSIPCHVWNQSRLHSVRSGEHAIHGDGGNLQAFGARRYKAESELSTFMLNVLPSSLLLLAPPAHSCLLFVLPISETWSSLPLSMSKFNSCSHVGADVGPDWAAAPSNGFETPGPPPAHREQSGRQHPT